MHGCWAHLYAPSRLKRGIYSSSVDTTRTCNTQSVKSVWAVSGRRFGWSWTDTKASLHPLPPSPPRLHGSWNSNGTPWRRNEHWQVRDDLLPGLYGQRDGRQGQTSLFVSVVLRRQNSILKMDGNCTFRCPFPLSFILDFQDWTMWHLRKELDLECKDVTHLCYIMLYLSACPINFLDCKK